MSIKSPLKTLHTERDEFEHHSLMGSKIFMGLNGGLFFFPSKVEWWRRRSKVDIIMMEQDDDDDNFLSYA